MKHLILLTFSFILFGAACKSTETRSNAPSGPTTVAQQIEKNPENAEKFDWIDEEDHNDTWVYVDEFPEMLNGMRDLQQRIATTVTRNPSEDCDILRGEQVIYQFVINEDGVISKIRTLYDEPNTCTDLVEITVRITQFTSGKVDGKPVSIIYAVPVKF
ncbi:MAG TPA: hypothetical protein VKP78_08090 [bacterium]|nr:hypothetical protein [bacterium]